MSENMIFCLGDGRLEPKGEGYQKNYRIFNKDVSKDRYSEVLDLIRNTIFKGLKLPITKIVKGELERQSYEDAWKEMWSEVTTKNKKKLQELQEFDAEIFTGITGIELSDTVKITCEGKEVEISRESAKALNLIT